MKQKKERRKNEERRKKEEEGVFAMFLLSKRFSSGCTLAQAKATTS